MRSVVTGGAGFIGSHLVDALVAAGDDVLVIDDLSTGREEYLAGALEAGASLAVGDISDAAFLKTELASFAPDRLFHLAAQASVRHAVADPAFDASVNVIGTINVLEAVRETGDAGVVFASTGGAVYGEGEGRRLPFIEASSADPHTPYGASKLAGEFYVALYRRLHDTPGVVLRFANVYGPRQDPAGEAGVVAIFCGRLLGCDRPIVFGDGLQTRDYIYVADAVEAMIAAASTLGDPPSPEPAAPLNIGTGTETSVLELLELLGAIAEIDSEPELRPPRAGEVQRVSIDPTAAASAIGWTPSVRLEDGLRRTFEAMRPGPPG